MKLGSLLVRSCNSPRLSPLAVLASGATQATGTNALTCRPLPSPPPKNKRGIHSGRNSNSSNSSSATLAFDRDLKRQQRDNAARAHAVWQERQQQRAKQQQEENAVVAATETSVISYDYLREEIALRLVDRLDDMLRPEGFPLALDMGAGAGYLHRAVCSQEALTSGGDDDDGAGNAGGMGGVKKLVQLDSCKRMLHRDESIPVPGNELCESYRLHADEEAVLPFPDGTFDLVMSSSALHWVNDLPKLFSEIHRVLKPDGCFLLAIIGGTTLGELRASLVMAEMERRGGVSPHVGPFVGLTDVGALLQRAGFALPTLDVDTITVSFPNAAVLMEHLQRMGENNASLGTTRTSLDTFLAACCIYDEQFGIATPGSSQQQQQTNEIEASVQVIYAIGWTPHASQPKPLPRGSATHKMAEISAVQHELISSSPDAPK